MTQPELGTTLGLALDRDMGFYDIMHVTLAAQTRAAPGARVEVMLTVAPQFGIEEHPRESWC